MYPFEILQVLGMSAHSEAVSAHVAAFVNVRAGWETYYRTIGSVFPDLGQPEREDKHLAGFKRFAGTESVRLEVCPGLFKTFVEDDSPVWVLDFPGGRCGPPACAGRPVLERVFKNLPHRENVVHSLPCCAGMDRRGAMGLFGDVRVALPDEDVLDLPSKARPHGGYASGPGDSQSLSFRPRVRAVSRSIIIRARPDLPGMKMMHGMNVRTCHD